ncbi:MAG: hypothetical protein Q7V57_11265 [Actinomycetota bacterium]|nr:hypothetical protein [Actinomycetota bacterium]
MTAPNTSAVYAVWRALERLLKATTFTVEDPTGIDIWFGDVLMPPAEDRASMDRIAVASFVEPADQEWGPIGKGSREERFTAQLQVLTAIPGRTALQAAVQLEAITSKIELMFRDLAQTRRAGTEPAEFAPYPSWNVELGDMSPRVVPSADGAIGSAVISVRCQFRIGTPPNT